MEATSAAQLPDLPDLLGGHAAAEADQPLITYLDDATGERTELSASALAAWATRTAGLVHEGCGLGVGSRAAVLLPPHWQTAAVLLGTWSAGVSVSVHLAATAGLTAPGTSGDEPLDLLFVSNSRLDDWLESVPLARHRFVLGLGPAATPMGEVPSGYRDYIAEAVRHTDILPAYTPVRRTDPVSADGTSYQEWGAVAREVAVSLDLRVGDRLLVDAGKHEHPLKWLLAPLSVGASVVVCANADPDLAATRVRAEHITHVL